MIKKILFLASVGIFIGGCGNTKEEKSETIVKEQSSSKSTENKQDVDTKQNISKEIALELSSNDQMKFDKNELTVYEGQNVTLTLIHTGKLEKTAMGHNFVLLQKDVDVAEFAEKAMESADTEYVPVDSKDVIANTKLIGGGETTSITFVAPKKGTYDYICSFPGHYGIMKGKFIVK